MKRASVCLALIFPVIAVADLRSDLQSKYRRLDQALAKKDMRTVSAWIRDNTTPDFSYTSKDKNRYDRSKFEKGLSDQIRVTKKIEKVSTRVVSLKGGGTSVTLTVDSDTDAIVTFDTREMKLVDKSRTVDIWVQSGGVWRLKKSVQIKGDTQMFPPGK